MEIKDFIEKFVEQFEDTDPSLFTPETKFHDLDEWSSLVGLSIIAMVDEEYDKTLRGEDLRTSQTVQDLFDKISQK